MPNRFQIKRTTTSGLLPNVSNVANTTYIAAGELAINLTDRKLLSSNGSATFEVGANLASIVVGTGFTQTSGNANFDSGVLFVDGTNNRVGVNNTTPGHALSVTGTLFAGNTTINGDLAIGGVDAGPNFISFRGTTGDSPNSYNHTYVGERIHTASEASELFLFKGNDPSTSGPDRVRIGAAEFRVDTYTPALSGTFETVASSANLTNKFIVTNAGNVGIGNSTPSSKLVVAGAVELGNTTVTGFANVSSTLAAGNTTVTGFINVSSTAQFGSNVGIGTGDFSSARLVVISPANSPSLLLTDATQSTLTVKHETGNLLTYEVTGSATQRWVGNSLERMRLDASGNLGIGNASPAHTLSVTGTTNLAGAVTGITTLAAGNTSITGFITATGDITAFFSDDRLKDRYSNIPNAVEKVKSLNGFYYEPNITAQDLGYQKEMHVGISAQEVNAIMPEVVAPAPIDNKYLTVKYDRLIPLLIEAIKEQQIQIDELKAQLNKD